MVKIFLADDHEIFLQGLKSLLRDEEEFEVVAAKRNGSNAWKYIHEHKPDIAVIDFRMPGMTGLEIAREVKQQGLPTSVILLTMHNNPLIVLEAKEENVRGYILKETAFENLVEAIREVVGGGTFFPKSLLDQTEKDFPLPLSERERLVLTAIAEGRTTKEIAKLLHIKPKTVETYRARITEKLDLHTIADMTRYAVKAGLVSHD